MSDQTVGVVLVVAIAIALSSLFWSCSRVAEQCIKANKCWHGGESSCVPCDASRGE